MNSDYRAFTCSTVNLISRPSKPHAHSHVAKRPNIYIKNNWVKQKNCQLPSSPLILNQPPPAMADENYLKRRWNSVDAANDYEEDPGHASRMRLLTAAVASTNASGFSHRSTGSHHQANLPSMGTARVNLMDNRQHPNTVSANSGERSYLRNIILNHATSGNIFNERTDLRPLGGLDIISPATTMNVLSINDLLLQQQSINGYSDSILQSSYMNLLQSMVQNSPSSMYDNRSVQLSQGPLQATGNMLNNPNNIVRHASWDDNLTLMLLLQKEQQLQQQQLQQQQQRQQWAVAEHYAAQQRTTSQVHDSSVNSMEKIVVERSSDRKSSEDANRQHKFRKWKKPKDKPKRPLSAYNAFFREERAKLLAALEETQTGDFQKNARIGFEDLGKEIGKRWRELPASRLDYYKDIAKQDSVRYQRELHKWSEQKKSMAETTEGKSELNSSTVVGGIQNRL